jgi:hypothetical protein
VRPARISAWPGIKAFSAQPPYTIIARQMPCIKL